MDEYLFFTEHFERTTPEGLLSPTKVVGGYILQIELKDLCDNLGYTNYTIKILNEIEFINTHES